MKQHKSTHECIYCERQFEVIETYEELEPIRIWGEQPIKRKGWVARGKCECGYEVK